MENDPFGKLAADALIVMSPILAITVIVSGIAPEKMLPALAIAGAGFLMGVGVRYY